MRKITVVTAASIIDDLDAGKLQKTYVTHDGPRHADEVLALARELAEEQYGIRVCFTRDEKILGLRNAPSLTFVDVGKIYAPGENRYDHHFKPVPSRRDGLPFSSFGLMSPGDEKDHALVRHVDAIDNGVKDANAPAWWEPMNKLDPHGGSVAWGVHMANPANVDGSAVTDAQFEERACALIELFSGLFCWDGTLLPDEHLAQAAVDVQHQLSVWHQEGAAALEASKLRVRPLVAAVAGAPILVMNQYEGGMLDEAAVGPASLLYVVFPGPGGRQWMVQQVAQQVGSFKGRKPLPEAWAGADAAKLAELTGVVDAVFCHVGKFVCAAKSRAGAVELAKLAVAS